LQYQVSSGERGINAFLMKERKDNPFYSASFQQDKPEPPTWFSLRLPSLPFVEVYGQSDNPQPAAWKGERDRLYRELDAAIEREDYAHAARVKQELDAFFDGKSRDSSDGR